LRLTIRRRNETFKYHVYSLRRMERPRDPRRFGRLVFLEMGGWFKMTAEKSLFTALFCMIIYFAGVCEGLVALDGDEEDARNVRFFARLGCFMVSIALLMSFT